jgi:hypothetical protein
MSKPAIRKSRDICGNFLGLDRLAHPYVRMPTAIADTPHPDRDADTPPLHRLGLCGRLPVQSQSVENIPEWGKKEQLRQRWRMHI